MVRAVAFSLCVLATMLSPQVMGAEQVGQKEAMIQERFKLAEKLLEAGQPQAAARQFLMVLHIDPDNAEAYANLGAIAYFGRDYAGAVHELSEALKRKPSLSNARALLGFSEERLGHVQVAASQLEEALPGIRDRKLRFQAGLELAQMDYQTGDLEKAIPILMVLQRLDPSNLDVLYASYRTFTELADQSVDALALVGMRSARMKQVVAETLIEEGDLPGAIAAFRAALKIDPQLPGIHLELGEAYLESRSNSALDDAEREFRAALAQNPNDAKAECGLGDVYLRRGDLPSTLRYYERATVLQPGSSEAYLGAGTALLEMNQLQRAATELREAIRLNPDSALAHYQLSLADSRLGKAGESQIEAAAFQRLKSYNEQLQNLFGEMRRPGEAKASSALVPQPPAIQNLSVHK
jgi:tetratricopeptide (TPR) repeat protein